MATKEENDEWLKSPGERLRGRKLEIALHEALGLRGEPSTYTDGEHIGVMIDIADGKGWFASLCFGTGWHDEKEYRAEVHFKAGRVAREKASYDTETPATALCRALYSATQYVKE